MRVLLLTLLCLLLCALPYRVDATGVVDAFVQALVSESILIAEPKPEHVLDSAFDSFVTTDGNKQVYDAIVRVVALAKNGVSINLVKEQGSLTANHQKIGSVEVSMIPMVQDELTTMKHLSGTSKSNSIIVKHVGEGKVDTNEYNGVRAILLFDGDTRDTYGELNNAEAVLVTAREYNSQGNQGTGTVKKGKYKNKKKAAFLQLGESVTVVLLNFKAGTASDAVASLKLEHVGKAQVGTSGDSYVVHQDFQMYPQSEEQDLKATAEEMSEKFDDSQASFSKKESTGKKSKTNTKKNGKGTTTGQDNGNKDTGKKSNTKKKGKEKSTGQKNTNTNVKKEQVEKNTQSKVNSVTNKKKKNKKLAAFLQP